MKFNYYKDLNSRLKRVYRESDALHYIPLRETKIFHIPVHKLKAALEQEDFKHVEQCSNKICELLCKQLSIPKVKLLIKSKRPSSNYEELQGLYEFDEDKNSYTITIWKKTAQKKKVVAFKTFLRTILHELCHHIDFTYYKFEDSLHTEGFFKRESQLFKDLTPQELQKKKVKQLELF